ncbi:GNAT family N-acetyltransferase, partial [Dietzia sp. UBA5065]|uniref:GNAT family N-acetyltransferase n=1 Tax=Dietzia sp. UBA5065 TaxID=1946422 RepID=UPI0025C6D884
AAVGARATVGLGRPGDLDLDTAAARLSALLTDEPERRRMASRAAALVDGLGAWRLVASWSALLDRPVHARRADEGTLTLRPAERSDAPLLLAWRNDPQARHWSRTSNPVDPDQHARWLTDSLSRSDRVLLVATDAAGPVGTVRWDRADHLDPSISHDRPDEWEVSITLAPDRRGAGLALDVLRAGEEHLAARHPVTAYLAVVHDDNRASRRLFARAGYLPDRPADADGFARLVAFARG